MRVNNYTNDIRENIIQIFDLVLTDDVIEAVVLDYYGSDEENEDISEELENKIKIAKRVFDAFQKTKLFKPAIEAMFICEYINVHMNYTFEQDVDVKESIMENIETLDDYENIEDFISTLDFTEFCILYSNLKEFYLDLTFYQKRSYIENLKEKSTNLSKKYPLFVNDFIFYMNKYDLYEILDKFNNYMVNYNNENLAIKDTIEEFLEPLKVLSLEDINNYNYIICGLIEKFYSYIKYLEGFGYSINKDQKMIMQMIETNIESLIVSSIDNKCIVGELIRGYINYELKKDDINKFYDSDKKQNLNVHKIIKKTHEIKNKKY